jgi:folate-binding protein YgfZ
MPTNHIAQLSDRGVINVKGGDAATLLDGLVTNSLNRLETLPAIHTGLLSPQGKILFDFFLVRVADGFMIDIAAAMADDLIKRLTFYRLRADVIFENVSTAFTVAAVWPAPIKVPGGIIGYPDPRHAGLGQRLILPSSRFAEIPAQQVDMAAYHAHRIALGVPAAGLDYQLPDTFPHEALYDQMGSIDFKKGCYIGQEVVSRMQHRGTARKRAMRITATSPLTPGAAIEAGSATIGTIGSAAGTSAIAVLRLDRASEAASAGTPITADGTTLELAPPDWIKFDTTSGKPRSDAS